MRQATRRNKLNPSQIHILKLIYKFRFVTPQLLAKYRNVNVWSINKSLPVLKELGYVDKKYERDFRIQGKGAIYYLTPKGMLYLRDEHNFNERALHTMYKNNIASQPFIERHINTIKACLTLGANYPGIFHMFTRTETIKYDYFIEPRPDLYLNRINQTTGNPNEYLLEFFANTQLFMIKKRFDVYIEHFDEGDWQAEAETSYPTLLFVCPSGSIERQFQSYAAEKLENSGIVELKVLTCTVSTVITSTIAKIWSDVTEPEVLLAL